MFEHEQENKREKRSMPNAGECQGNDTEAVRLLGTKFLFLILFRSGLIEWFNFETFSLCLFLLSLQKGRAKEKRKNINRFSDI